jgi:putative OPT family oligopeptide transporter
MAATPGKKFEPFVADDVQMAEFTPKAIILGALFGIIFGTATVYLALRAGLTVSASVPIAVLAIAVFKRFGQSTILENNMVQTIGSAGESVAAGVVFTVPALLFLSGGENFFTYGTIFVLAAVGGSLGVLFMIPLRRALIVKEHGNLPYPEGTACADVLIAGEKGGDLAKMVFAGVGVAMLYKFLYGIIGLWNETATWFRTKRDGLIPDATLQSDVTPEYLGLGYIIGPRIAGELAAGGVLAWLALIPLISMFVPETRLVDDLTKLGFSEGWRDSHAHAEWIYRAYIRYIGAGAVACAGVMTLLKTLPTIVSAFRESVKSFRGGAGASGQARTDRDLGMKPVLFGSIALALLITILPKFPHGEFPGSLLMGLLVVVFGFFFVTVSSRIVGIIGTSSNPISGMTIATIMATCVIFVLVGRTGDVYQPIALCVGALVCIAAANAGATSQDLKTGYLVGATPKFQQIAILVGSLLSAVALGPILLKLNDAATVYVPVSQVATAAVTTNPANLPAKLEAIRGPQAGSDAKAYHVWHKLDAEGGPAGKYLVDDAGTAVWFVDPGINGTINTRPDGSTVHKFDAPKATLMSYIIRGILDRHLPWGLVLFGVMIAIVLEMAGIPSLAFAVGVYLPLSSSSPILIGGIVRLLVDRAKRKDLEHLALSEAQLQAEGDKSPGVLMASGYIAGGAIAGIVIAYMAGVMGPLDQKLTEWSTANNPFFSGPRADLLALIPFAALTVLLLATGQAKNGGAKRAA